MFNPFKRLFTQPTPPVNVLDVSTNAGYLVACALRGPDLPLEIAETLKYVFTRRIRTLAGVADISRLTRRIPISLSTANRLQRLVLTLRERQNTNLRSGVCHFLGHTSDAADALGDRNLAALASNIWKRALNYEEHEAVSLSPEAIIRLAGGEE